MLTGSTNARLQGPPTTYALGAVECQARATPPTKPCVRGPPPGPPLAPAARSAPSRPVSDMQIPRWKRVVATRRIGVNFKGGGSTIKLLLYDTRDGENTWDGIKQNGTRGHGLALHDHRHSPRQVPLRRPCLRRRGTPMYKRGRADHPRCHIVRGPAVQTGPGRGSIGSGSATTTTVTLEGTQPIFMGGAE